MTDCKTRWTPLRQQRPNGCVARTWERMVETLVLYNIWYNPSGLIICSYIRMNKVKTMRGKRK